jgi:hypothetical protein
MDIEQDERRNARRWYWAVLAVYALAMFNVFVPAIRSTDSRANTAFTAFVQLLPIGLLASGWIGWRGARRVGTMVLALSASAVALAGAVVCVFGLLFAGILTKETVDTVSLGRGRIATYHVDAGAMAPSAIIVRQEWPLVLGIMLVKELASEDGETVSITRLGHRQVRLTFPAYGAHRATPKVVLRTLLPLP